MPCYCCFRNSRTAGITCVWHLTPSKEQKKNADDDEFYAFSPRSQRRLLRLLDWVLSLFCFIPLASGFILQCPNGILMDPHRALAFYPYPFLFPHFFFFANERVLSSGTEKMAQRLWRLLNILLMWRCWRIPS